MRVKTTLVLSLALLVLLVVFTLTHAPPRVVRVGAKPEVVLSSTTGAFTVCQPNELLPPGVSAIRLGLEASFGPKMLVQVYSRSNILTAGSRRGDWTGSSVTIPVEQLKYTSYPVKLCASAPANGEFLQLYGVHTAYTDAAVGGEGQRLPGRLSVEYLAPGSGSWWSRALSVARHVGIGHAVSGTWVAVLVAMLMAAASALVIGLAWRALV